MKRWLEREELDGVLVACGVGPAESYEELTEGNFNTAYRVRTRDGSGYVLKVAPDPAEPVMTYERGLMRTEALFYREAHATVPVPRLVHASDDGYLLMTERAGTTWYSQRATLRREPLRTDLGGIVAVLHQVKGPAFGYPQLGLRSTWREAFLSMVDAVLSDAARFAMPVPEGIGELMRARAEVFDEVITPVLVHFDLWDGNILVDGSKLSLIDGERAFWGDPLAELVSLALYGDIEQDTAFLRGYSPLVFDAAARRRLAAYRAYLYLIMLVETVPRGQTGSTADVREQLTAALSQL